MQRILLLLIIVILPSLAAAVDYRIEVELFPTEQRLTGRTEISRFELRGSKLVLALAEQIDVLSVTQAGKVLDFAFTGGRLSIEPADSSPVVVAYQGRFTDAVDGIPVHNEDPSYGVTAGIGEQGTFLSAAANWYPRHSGDAERYQLRVTTPAGIEAVTSGRRLSRIAAEKSVSEWLVDYPLSGMTLSAGPYQVFEDSFAATPIYAYFYPGSAEYAASYLQKAKEYLELYQGLFGPYPFHKFAVVENFFPTGYGFPSWTLLGSSVIRLPFIVNTSLGHEIAHSWWGTGVRVDYDQGNWSEGLTTYVADYLYKEQQSDQAALEYRLKILRDYAALVKTDNRFPLRRFISRKDKASQAIGYGKAAMVFHMLRQRVGDELFWTTLKQIAQNSMFRTVGWDHFEDQFSRAAGQDLTAFFRQWLQRADGPKLSLQEVRLHDQGDHYEISGRIEQEKPVYRLELSARVKFATGAENFPVRLDKSSNDFSIQVKQRPVSLTIDPNADLFRLLADTEIPPTVNSVRSSTNLLAIRAEQAVPSGPAMTTLLGALRKPDVKIRELADLSQEELSGRDLLIFGTGGQLQPDRLAGQDLLIREERLELTGKSTFLVTQNPFSEKRIAAWFISADHASDRTVARKIPHYGKYSYLLFSGTTNQNKGTFAPQSSPLEVEFRSQNSAP